jgi:uncharacterized protein YbjT (DUF2867 family)
VKILVTGGSGFLGSEVIPQLCARGHEVMALARSDAAARRVAILGAQAQPGDLDDPSSVDEAFALSAPDVLINLASLGFGHAPVILAAAEEAGISRGVFVSTTAIFTTLPAPSRRVRVEAEDAIRASAMRWTLVRPTMIYGDPGDRNMVRLLRLLKRSPFVPIPGGGDRLLQPVHVADLASFIVRSAFAEESIDVAYDVAGPDALSLRQVVEAAAAAVGRRPRIIPIPLRPIIVAAQLYEKVAAHPRLKSEQILRLDEDKVFDIGPARTLGYRPMTFAEGISSEARMLV